MSDLIDRNKAIEAIHADLMGGLNYKSILKEMPTVDAEPVRHGKWLEREDDYDWYVFCSECGDEYVEDKDLRVASWVKQYFNYCPYCGAKMDKRKKNEID